MGTIRKGEDKMEQTVIATEQATLSPRTLKRIVEKVLTSDAVDYSPRDGVTCPVCGAHLQGRSMGVRRTCPWVSSSRERYHTCPICGMRFKSVELELLS
jgi:uncharacterized protein (DUF2225 family)